MSGSAYTKKLRERGRPGTGPPTPESSEPGQIPDADWNVFYRATKRLKGRWLDLRVEGRFLAAYLRRTLCVLYPCTGGTVGAYVVLQAYEFFVLAFTGLVVVDTALALSCGPPSPAKWFCFCASVGAIITGKLAWEVRPHSAAADSLQPRRLACRLQPAAPECGARLCSLPPCRRRFARSARVIVRAQSLPPQVENRWCAVAPSVWPLHVMWHFLAAASAYYGVLFNILNRFEAGIRSAALPAAAVESGRLALRWAGLPYSVASAPRSGRGASTPRDRSSTAQASTSRWCCARARATRRTSRYLPYCASGCGRTST